jgi:gliding motility-associated-like protein
VRVRNAVSSFTAPLLVCAGNAVTFNGTASADVFFGCSRGYVWYYDNDPPQDGTSPVGFHTFSAPGTHTVSLMVKDLNSCSDISTKTLTVSDVTPAFSLSSSLICHSGTVMITNNTSHTPDSIASYNWNFGNGQTLTTTLQTVPVQTYTFANVPFSTYNIFLTATNKKGCSKMATQQLKVVKPNASFIATPQGMCVSATTPTTVTFIAQGAHPSYTFNYGSSTQSAIVTSSISTYTFSPGNYTVTMTVLDTSGCVNSSSLTINAVQVPVADFTFTSPGSSGGNNICAPNPVVFTNVSLPQPYTANWSIPNQTLVPLNKITVSFSVTSTTAITVSMSVNTGAPYFCSATAAKNLTVYIAKANIVASKTLVCLGDEVMFSIDTANGGGVKSWVWDFGDASSTTTVQAVSAIKGPVPHKYSNYSATAAGNVTTSLIYYSSGDVCRYSAEIPVKIINVVAGFKRNSETVALDSVHCLKIPDRFNSISTTNDKRPLSYSWSFPGGNTYSDSLVNHTFAQPGTQQVSLTVTEPANNCKATAVKSMTIFGLPTATITPAQVCPNKPFTLTVTASPAVNSATWAAGSGIIGSMQFTTASNPFYSQGVIPATTVYSLMVSDTNNCASENVMQEIEVMKPPPVVNWDTAVVIGERIPLNGYVGNFTYSWTPFNSHLSCTACASPVSTTTDNATYTVMVEDLAHCAIVKSIYKIEILPRSSVDVPGAFTPNGDGINDRIFVGGWGIKNLNYFRIFNRWGQLLFESSDISVGWDGTYNGVPQNIDTYIYQVSVDNYIDTKPLLKSSTFKLLR